MIRAVIFDMFETLITHYKSPLYFSAQMAEDVGINVADFRAVWYPSEDDRTMGKLTLEEALENALKELGCYSEELLNKMVEKRRQKARNCFKNLHPEIIPMLSWLKEKGICVGLISNCFSEETEVIRTSPLFPYFDAAFLSYEQGMKKPDHRIYTRCMDAMQVLPRECLYIGDGGSHELETARELGMQTAQAAWYLKEGLGQPAGRKPEFIQLETPMDVFKMVL